MELQKDEVTCPALQLKHGTQVTPVPRLVTTKTLALHPLGLKLLPLSGIPHVASLPGI